MRVDTHLYTGYEVPPYYDSLLAKLIVWGETREIALARSRRALAEFQVGGIKTNLPFHRGIIDNAAFLEARGEHQPARPGRTGRLRRHAEREMGSDRCRTDAATTDGAFTLPLEAADIMRIIPHRYPFLLIDRIVELEPGMRAVAIKNVTANEPQFTGHFPGRPIMPGVLMVEALAQTAAVAVLSLDEYRGKLGLFAGIDDAASAASCCPATRCGWRSRSRSCVACSVACARWRASTARSRSRRRSRFVIPRDQSIAGGGR